MKMTTKKRKYKNDNHDNDDNGDNEENSVQPDITAALINDNNNPSDFDESENEEKIIEQEIAKQNRKGKKSGGFQSMGLSNTIYKAIIQKGFKVPTPIQRKTIPVIINGEDVVGMARTGSGKTAAFVIPMIEKLKSHRAKVGARALIMSPSRELALQTLKVVKELGKLTDLRSVILVGGDSLDEQFKMMATNPDILIATPGRLLHLTVEMELDMKSIEYVVFDEADRLFEMGFDVQLHEILHRLSTHRQTLLFSATLPKSLVEFAKAGLQDPTLVRLDTESKISSDLEMAFFHVKPIEKESALLCLLRHVIKIPLASEQDIKNDNSLNEKGKKKRVNSNRDLAPHQTIIFAATKHAVEYLSAIIQKAGYSVSYIYGALDQTARKIQIENFSSGNSSILVVTDVAARGIDIPILQNVINYDFIDKSKIFVHRVGRAARAGRRGWAYSLLTTVDIPYLLDLQLFLARPLITPDKIIGKEDIAYNSNIVVGGIQRELLDAEMEWLGGIMSNDNTLFGLKGVANNGYKMYGRSKVGASQESHKRAKELIIDEKLDLIHPLLSDGDVNIESKRMNILNSIANYRPTETVFEVGHRGQKKMSDAAQIMRQRRQTLSKKINSAQERKKEREKLDNTNNVLMSQVGDIENVSDDQLEDVFKKEPKKEMKDYKDYKDQEFYLPHFNKDFNTEKGYSVDGSGSFAQMASMASMDLIGDDAEGIRTSNNVNNVNSRRGLRWDAKKKKFVMGDGIGSNNKKLITSESGKKIPASFKSGRFVEWQKENKMSLPRIGEEELGIKGITSKRFKHSKLTAAKELDPLRDDYQRKKRQKMEDEKKNGKKVKNELKNVDQIRKQRKIKEQRRAKNARPSKKRKR